VRIVPTEQVLREIGTVAAWAAGALVVGRVSSLVIHWATRRYHYYVLGLLHRRCHKAWMLLLLVYALYTAVPADGPISSALHQVLLLALIGAAAWMVIGVLYVIEDMAFRRLPMDVQNNRRVRKVRTQIGVLRRLTAAIVAVLALGTMLMTFDSLHALGTSLLASAGVAGAIAGLAAQTTLRNVLAGLQLALSDQLRFDDVVVVEDEWGRIEELALTHVVVRLWDERRLMLPTAYFITTPFQNWTRNEARVLGSVELHLAYTAPVEELRAETRRIVELSPLWDRRDWVLQVVDSTPWTMVVRVLASSADAPSNWDLRCEIREQLIAFLRTEHPDAPPGVPGDETRPGSVPVDFSVVTPQERLRRGPRSVPPGE
jgi:small-conductance mechanosensitive channel